MASTADIDGFICRKCGGIFSKTKALAVSENLYCGRCGQEAETELKQTRIREATIDMMAKFYSLPLGGGPRALRGVFEVTTSALMDPKLTTLLPEKSLHTLLLAVLHHAGVTMVVKGNATACLTLTISGLRQPSILGSGKVVYVVQLDAVQELARFRFSTRAMPCSERIQASVWCARYLNECAPAQFVNDLSSSIVAAVADFTEAQSIANRE